MSISLNLLQAERIGIRELREGLSRHLKVREPLIVTEHGSPTKVIFSYDDIIELLEILEDLQNPETLHNVIEGRKAIKAGAKGTPVSELFDKFRSKR